MSISAYVDLQSSHVVKKQWTLAVVSSRINVQQSWVNPLEDSVLDEFRVFPKPLLKFKKVIKQTTLRQLQR